MSLDNLTDPRLLAVQRATQNMAPEQAMQYIHQVADSGTVPGSLAYLMGLYQKVKALQNMKPGAASQMAQPTVRQQMESQLDQGIAQLPTPALERPGTFKAADGGIVAFADGSDDEPVSATGSLDDGYLYPTLDPERARALELWRQGNIPEARRVITEADSKPRKIRSRVAAEQELQETPEAKRLAELRASGLGQLQQDLADVDKNDQSKAKFFIEMGSKLASSSDPFLSALASSAGPAATEYLSSKEKLSERKRGLKKELRDMSMQDAQSVYENLVRRRDAIFEDEKLSNAEKDRQGNVVMSGIKAAQDALNEKARNAAAAARDTDPWTKYYSGRVIEIEERIRKLNNGDPKNESAVAELQRERDALLRRGYGPARFGAAYENQRGAAGRALLATNTPALKKTADDIAAVEEILRYAPEGSAMAIRAQQDLIRLTNKYQELQRGVPSALSRSSGGDPIQYFPYDVTADK